LSIITKEDGMLEEKLAQTVEFLGVSESKVLTMITDNGSNMVEAIGISRDYERDSQERETHEQQRDEACNTDEDEEDRQIDHDRELDNNKDDNDKDYDRSNDGSEGDDNNVANEADNMLAEPLNFHIFSCTAHCLQLVVSDLAKSQSFNNLLAKVKGLVGLLTFLPLQTRSCVMCVTKLMWRNVSLGGTRCF
jgi:hypothetical protein